jgi:hypothetical protein
MTSVLHSTCDVRQTHNPQDVFYPDAHYLFVCSAPGASKIVAVLRMPDAVKKAYHALVVDRTGFADHWIPQKAIVGEVPCLTYCSYLFYIAAMNRRTSGTPARVIWMSG